MMTESNEDLFAELKQENESAEASAPKKRSRKKAAVPPAAKTETPSSTETAAEPAALPPPPQEEPLPVQDKQPDMFAPAEEKPAEEKPAEEKPAEEKPAEEKPAEEKPAEEKPAEEKPAEEKPHASPSLLSGLLHISNAGSGIISLSRSGTTPQTTPAPAKAPQDKKHQPQNGGGGNQPQSNRQNSVISSPNGGNGFSHANIKANSGNGALRGNNNTPMGGGNGRQRGSSSFGGSKFVRDDVAFVEQSMDETEMDAVYEPAYVDDVKHDIVRPRLDRYELLKTSPEILAHIGTELGGLVADGNMTLAEFVDELIARNNAADGVDDVTFGSGVVVRTKESGDFGILRSAEVDYVGTTADIYLTPLYMKRYGLRVGDAVLGTIKRRDKDGMSAMIKVYAINGIAPDQRRGLRPFETLIPYYPTQRLTMENGEKNYSMRIMDLITPIGRGQRGLIVAPPRTGKTVMLQNMANALLANNSDLTLIVMLIDERPEEVTDMRACVKAEVVASTFDEPPEKHKELMELVMERCKRLVENGRHVAVLLDSITRLARAYNTLAPKSGRILSGGLDANALYAPKRFFGAARNIQGGGSLTILATALIDTGSRMDELIFEEFKGTGNMELHLDRALADRRIFPAVNCMKSGTRREELIVGADELEQMWSLRKALSRHEPCEAMEKLLKNITPFSYNSFFLLRIRKAREENAARDANNSARNNQPQVGVAELGDIRDELQS